MTEEKRKKNLLEMSPEELMEHQVKEHNKRIDERRAKGREAGLPESTVLAPMWVLSGHRVPPVEVEERLFGGDRPWTFTISPRHHFNLNEYCEKDPSEAKVESVILSISRLRDLGKGFEECSMTLTAEEFLKFFKDVEENIVAHIGKEKRGGEE